MRTGDGIGALLIAGLVAAASGPAAADALNLSTKNRAGLFKSQLSVLDGRASQQYAGSARLQPKSGKAAAGGSAAIPTFRGSYRGQYLEAAKAAARKHGIPEDLFLRLVQQESGFNPRALSHKGAI